MGNFYPEFSFGQMMYLSFLKGAELPNYVSLCFSHNRQRFPDFSSFQWLCSKFVLNFVPKFVLNFILNFVPNFVLNFVPNFIPIFVPNFVPNFVLNFVPNFVLIFVPNFVLNFVPNFVLNFVPNFVLNFVLRTDRQTDKAPSISDSLCRRLKKAVRLFF